MGWQGARPRVIGRTAAAALQARHASGRHDAVVRIREGVSARPRMTVG